MERVDWQFIVDGYNKQRASSLTEKQIIQRCYDALGSVQHAADYLGVDYNTLTKRMDKLHVERIRRKNQPTKLASRIMAIPASKLCDMTFKQIAKVVNCHPASVWRVCSQLNREYKKRWRQTKC